MIGKDFWDDLGISSIDYEEELKKEAQELIDQWGKDLTERDLLRLSALSKALDSRVEGVIAKYALDYYLTFDHNPAFIHQYNHQPEKTPWWKFWKKPYEAFGFK